MKNIPFYCFFFSLLVLMATICYGIGNFPAGVDYEPYNRIETGRADSLQVLLDNCRECCQANNDELIIKAKEQSWEN